MVFFYYCVLFSRISCGKYILLLEVHFSLISMDIRDSFMPKIVNSFAGFKVYIFLRSYYCKYQRILEVLYEYMCILIYMFP